MREHLLVLEGAPFTNSHKHVLQAAVPRKTDMLMLWGACSYLCLKF